MILYDILSRNFTWTGNFLNYKILRERNRRARLVYNNLRRHISEEHEKYETGFHSVALRHKYLQILQNSHQQSNRFIFINI